MNRRWLQFIACSLAVCFALAGAVALHPALHRWVEHGGAGAAHHHLHPHPHLPLRGAKAVQHAAKDPNALTLFGLQPQDVYRALLSLISDSADSSPAAPDDGDTEHTHHSLPQLLLSGLVEGAVEITPLVIAPERCSLFCLLAESVIVAGEFYSPTAGRGPPFFC